jgi:hypothetical protein
MHRSDLFALVVGMSVGMCGGALGALLALRVRSSELPHVVRPNYGLDWEAPGLPLALALTADTRRETSTLSPWIVVRDKPSRLYLLHSGRR